MDDGTIRKFESGATRDTSKNKLDYEAFLSPEVMSYFAAYMHKHREQSDGTLRPGDNWQKGIPRNEYAKSLIRHTFQFWMLHRGIPVFDDDGENVTLVQSLCAILFNAQGYLFELIRRR